MLSQNAGAFSMLLSVTAYITRPQEDLLRLGQPVDTSLCDLKILVGRSSTDADRAQQEVVLVEWQTTAKDYQTAIGLLDTCRVVSIC